MKDTFYSFPESDRKLFETFFSNNPEATERRQIIQNFSRLMAYYKCAMMELETKFNVLNEEFSLKHDRTPISSIKTRLKNSTALYQSFPENISPHPYQHWKKTSMI